MNRVYRVLILLALPALLGAQAVSPFPHARHAKLFPLCSSCHTGVTIRDSVRIFPAASLCATCHNGTVQPRVNWAAPARSGAGLLVFSHQRHAAITKGISCESCHELADTKAWMHVARAAPEQCMSCHTQGKLTHLADGTVCSNCHRPLTAAVALTDARIAELPQPPSHARADFMGTHGEVARTSTASCATCHARESCQRCHVDGARAPVILALGTDARVARLMRGRTGTYGTPADHRNPLFAVLHGKAATTNIGRCATCHTRASCASCHIGEGARDVLRRMPDARESTSPGVQLRHGRAAGESSVRLTANAASPAMPIPQSPQIHHDTTQRTVRVHAAGFARAHGAQAASGAAQCASCHAQRFCTDCHAGERVTRRYHVANFVSTHAPQAYRRETECSACHSTEAFCRDCHRQTGLASTSGARSRLFHNAQPLWLLQHGRAARQDLKSCTTCHQQSYCMQCHSDLGAKTNPHGPQFDAARMSNKNPRLCLYCHLTNPLAK